jgi:hypothetical protein
MPFTLSTGLTDPWIALTEGSTPRNRQAVDIAVYRVNAAADDAASVGGFSVGG